MIWDQHEIKLPPYPRGLHLITPQVVGPLAELPRIKTGMLHVFVRHTSASVTINENADPDVRVDLESSLNRLAPESAAYTHTIEGSDDMPAHVKSSLMGSSVTVPVRDGQLALGTWQGIYLCEHRNRGGQRRLVVTLFGEPH